MDDLLHQILDNEYEIQDDRQMFRDGGTIGFSIKNADGQIQHLFLDGRIDSTTKGVFYKGYPGSEGSIQLGSNDELAIKIKGI